MRSLVVVSVVLGLASAAPVLPRNPAVLDAETQAFLQTKAAADAAFLQEYNRLALLAAEAPDIHIYTDDSQIPEEQHLRFQTEEVVQSPVEHLAEDVAQDQVQRVAGHQAGHMAGHMAGHNVQFVPTHTLTAQEIIVPKWEGPLADTIPAGVNGLPRQVTETPEVLAARQALLDAHAAVPKPDPEYNPSPADNVQEVQIAQEYTIAAENEQPEENAQATISLNQIPHDFSFQAKNEPTIVSHNQAGLLAGHMAGHLAGQHASMSSDETLTVEEPVIGLVGSRGPWDTHVAKVPAIKKWEGPYADTEPAGVIGKPVTETPAVQQARLALYAAHAAVAKSEPEF